MPKKDKSMHDDWAVFQAPDGSIRRGNGTFSRRELQIVHAAPDLLEAARRAEEGSREAIKEIDGAYPDYNKSPQWVEDIRGFLVSVRDEAQACIAKAEG